MDVRCGSYASGALLRHEVSERALAHETRCGRVSSWRRLGCPSYCLTKFNPLALVTLCGATLCAAELYAIKPPPVHLRPRPDTRKHRHAPCDSRRCDGVRVPEWFYPGGTLPAARIVRCRRPATNARPYNAATNIRRSRYPTIKAEYSRTPPTIAPSRFVPKATVEAPTWRKRSAKIKFARKIGANARDTAAAKRAGALSESKSPGSMAHAMPKHAKRKRYST